MRPPAAGDEHRSHPVAERPEWRHDESAHFELRHRVRGAAFGGVTVFKTLKYHPSFPGRFGDQGQAKTFCRSFFRWYNAEHRHGGISMLTPEQVHFGRADNVIARRTTVLNTAWTTHPERFVRGVPKPKPLPEAVWINPPTTPLSTQEIAL